MMRLLVLLVLCAGVSLFSWAANAQMKPVPLCLSGFCLDTSELPREKAIRARFGGAKQRASLKNFAYCYRFIAAKQNSYGYFLLKDLGSGLRLVTIRLSQNPLCDNANTVELKDPPSTKEGVRLAYDEAEVLKRYGKPSYALNPPSNEVVRDFFGTFSNVSIDVVDQYVGGNNKDPSTALFYIAHGKVVGIEVTVDE